MTVPDRSTGLLDLLEEWFRYWDEQDHMPTKMPDALHVRTAVALTIAGRDVGVGPLQHALDQERADRGASEVDEPPPMFIPVWLDPDTPSVEDAAKEKDR